MIVAALAAASVVFVLSGGRLSQLGEHSSRAAPLLALLFVAQGLARGRLPYVTGEAAWSVLIWAVCGVTILAIAWMAYRGIPGIGLVVAGLACNLFVVLANGGMPVVLPEGRAWSQFSTFYHPASSVDIAAQLGDVLPTGTHLLSVGDMLLFIGAFAMLLAMGSGRGCGVATKPTTDLSSSTGVKRTVRATLQALWSRR